MSTNTIILFQSRAGTTEKVAGILADKLGNNPTLINLKRDKVPPLDNYSNIIIGGSIRASMIQSGIKKFVSNNIDTIKEKKLGLFLCCMEEGETANNQFSESYPEELRNIALATGLFGGEFNLNKLNFLEKGIVKKVAGITESVSKINYDEIEKFAGEFNK